MDRSVRVHSYGVCLGLAFAEQLAGRRDTQGLVFGSEDTEIISSVSDRGTKSEARTNIGIQSFHPTIFVSSGLEIDENLLQDVIKDQQSCKLLGWFVFRGNAPLRPSIKEVSIHRQLQRRIFRGQDTLPIFVILTTSSSANSSTHSFDCRVVRSSSEDPNIFVPLDLAIKNLSNSSRSEYSLFCAKARMPVGGGKGGGSDSGGGGLRGGRGWEGGACPPSELSPCLGQLLVPSPMVLGLESHCHAAIHRVQALTDQIIQRDCEVADAMAEVERLEAELEGLNPTP